ncbi:MAG: response regulator [Saprospiraceae bacterium]
MNDFTILVVEDDFIIAADLQARLNRMGYSVPRTVASGNETLAALEKFVPDLILLDIQLKGSLDGISVASLIQEKYQIPIIFLTSNTDSLTFDRARKVNPAAFLSKPLRQKDLQHAIELIREKREQVDEGDGLTEETIVLQDRIFIRNKSKMERVFFADIHYMEADRAYCKLVTDQQNFHLSLTLKGVMEQIQLTDLVRVHRSFAVNIKKMTGFSDLYVYFDDVKIPIGRAHKEQFMKLIRTI